MNNIYLTFTSLILASSLFTSCSQANTPQTATTPTSSPGAEKTIAKTNQSAWEIEWNRMLSEAKKEGKVVVYISAGGDIRVALSQAFNEKYGISVEVVTATGSELGVKIPREQKAGLYLADVLIGGTTAAINVLKPGGYLEPLEPVLILPEVVDPKGWWAEKLPWVDRENRYILSFLAYPSSPLAINTDLIKSEEIRSYGDLLNPRWKGKIVMQDPTISGTGLVTFRITAQKMGLDYMQNLAKQNPTIVRDRRLPIEWLSQGRYTIDIAPDSSVINDFIRAGAHLQEITPGEGAHLTGGYGTLALPAKAPHPNASRIFINWLLSREGQTVFSKSLLNQSARVDISVDFLQRTTVRQPGVDYYWTYTEEWLTGQDEAMKVAKQIFGELIK